MHVGVRELKQHLSEYLDRVASGEVVVVTDRGVPKVVMAAAPGVDQFAQGVAEGWITPPKRTDGLGAPVRQRSSKRIVDVLLEDRGE
jgi:prevent-host-death family protein